MKSFSEPLKNNLQSCYSITPHYSSVYCPKARTPLHNQHTAIQVTVMCYHFVHRPHSHFANCPNDVTSFFLVLQTIQGPVLCLVVKCLQCLLIWNGSLVFPSLSGPWVEWGPASCSVGRATPWSVWYLLLSRRRPYILGRNPVEMMPCTEQLSAVSPWEMFLTIKFPFSLHKW